MQINNRNNVQSFGMATTVARGVKEVNPKLAKVLIDNAHDVLKLGEDPISLHFDVESYHTNKISALFHKNGGAAAPKEMKDIGTVLDEVGPKAFITKLKEFKKACLKAFEKEEEDALKKSLMG